MAEYHFVQMDRNPFDYQGVIAAIFVLMVAEIFAIGLRMKEEQDLTV